MNHELPFRLPSMRSDYACPDGEVASTSNLRVKHPDLLCCVIRPEDEFFRHTPSTLSPLSSTLDTSLHPSLPSPQVEFALRRTILPGWHIHPDQFPSEIIPQGEPTEKGWGVRAMQTLARFENRMLKENLFFEPFFAIAALRLKDGSRIHPSPPMLMIPDSTPPALEGSTDFTSETMKISVVAAVCSLQMRVRIPEEIAACAEITHLDILISPSIPLYDRKGDATAFHRFSHNAFTHSIASDGTAGERLVCEETIVQGWMPECRSEAEIFNSMINAVEFRLVSELPLSGLPSTTEFEDILFNCGGLTLLSASEPYHPDFRHLSTLSANGSTTISGRKTMWDLTLISPLPEAIDFTAPFSTDPDLTPRWIFHPDPDLMLFPFESSGEMVALPLRRHPNLYGSFYWRGLGDEEPVVVKGYEPPSLGSRTKEFPAAIWRSSKGSGLHLPDSLFMNLDVERVIALCRAFRSSGLVATTSPTVYAFTSEGVFLLKEMDDGTFRDAGLICSYVLRDSGSFFISGRSVEFITVDGETIVIEGTSVKVKGVGGTASASSASSSIPAGIAFESIDPEMEYSLLTRPLKLDNPEGWKRVSAVTVRGNFNSTRMRLTLHGSPDLTRWYRIAGRNGATGTGRNGAVIAGFLSPPFRFFRVELSGTLLPGESLEAIVFESKK